MKKLITLVSLVAMFAMVAPVMAQDSEPAPAPADCKALKGKERAACEKAKKDAKKNEKKADKK